MSDLTMDNRTSCKDCVHWTGRTDTNKCKLHPDIVPEWSTGCSDHTPFPIVDANPTQDMSALIKPQSRISQAQQSRVRNITIVAQTNSWMETKKLGDLLTKTINEQVLPGKVFKVSSVTTASTRPPQESRATRLANAISQIQDGLSEVESLAGELTSWKDNMGDAGTGLENTDKYSRLGEAVEALESAKENIETEVGNLEGVEIPGMFD